MKEKFPPDGDLQEGCVININKPLGWTSTDVVRKIKFALQKCGYRKLKVGHAGTLDPLATGVLLVCLGKATKRVEELQAERKEYVAEIVLGATTPSYDLEHPIDRRFPYEHITEQMVVGALEGLCGERLQTPPVYSAKKIEGQRAYEYAREGVDVEMRKALVNIYAMELLEFDLPRVRVRVECSKGTYIRSIAAELGEKLESGGHLSALERTRSGGYNVQDAYTMDEITEITGGMKQK